jgi:hypothetical protein
MCLRWVRRKVVPLALVVTVVLLLASSYRRGPPGRSGAVKAEHGTSRARTVHIPQPPRPKILRPPSHLRPVQPASAPLVGSLSSRPSSEKLYIIPQPTNIANIGHAVTPSTFAFPHVLPVPVGRAEAYIRMRQEPMNCNQQHFWVAKPRHADQVVGGGLISVIKELLGCFAQALAQNMTFVVADNMPMGSYGLQFTDLFQPPTSCPMPAGGWLKQPGARIVDTSKRLICWNRDEGPADLIPPHLLSVYDNLDAWRGELAHWLLRPSPGYVSVVMLRIWSCTYLRKQVGQTFGGCKNPAWYSHAITSCTV